MPTIKLSATARKALLKKVFKEGAEALKEKELKSLFRGTEKLYRHDIDPKQLLKEGWNPSRPKSISQSVHKGIHYTDDPHLIPYYTGGRAKKPNVVAIKNPEAAKDVFLGAQEQIVQMKPKGTLVKIEVAPKIFKYKVLGIAATAGVGLKLNTQNTPSKLNLSNKGKNTKLDISYKKDRMMLEKIK